VHLFIIVLSALFAAVVGAGLENARFPRVFAGNKMVGIALGRIRQMPRRITRLDPNSAYHHKKHRGDNRDSR
jgi:hypothetical protein